MSDLEKLFRLCGSGPKPLENFTTAALAIAIGHDDAPIKRALSSVVLDGCCKEDQETIRAILDLASRDDVRVSAETQQPLIASDLELGYLDLVLTIRCPGGPNLIAWVEVKVNAWEHGPQISVYRAHAARSRGPTPVVLTLGRQRVRPDTPHLRWADLSQAIRLFPGVHYTWRNLDEFLGEQRVVTPPLPPDPISDAMAHIDVIVSVNGRVRELWPSAGIALAWGMDGRLQSVLEKGFKERHDLTATGGPLRYGLLPVAGGWEWELAVRTDNFYKVPVRSEDILRDAEVGGLPNDWTRHGGAKKVLTRRLPAGEAAPSDVDVVAWFEEGLRQLRDSRILDRYLSGYVAKYSKHAPDPPSNGNASGPDQA